MRPNTKKKTRLSSHLELLLQAVAEDAVELVDVVLLEGVAGVPAKGAGEVLSGHRARRELQLRQRGGG